MTDQARTEEEALKPTLGEQITELFSRVAKLNDQTAAVLAPEWGARMGIIPEGHPLHPGVSCSPDAPESEPNNPAATEATERPTLRERHRAQWLALTDAERAARIAALDKDDEPEHPARTTPNNPATSDGTPPAHTSVNAENCPACKGTNPPYPFICPGPDTAAVDEVDEAAGAWTPDPPIECLTVTAERTPPQLPGLRDQLADATVPLLLDTLPKVIARARGYEVADAVLTLLYREWPWLRAAAEDAAAALAARDRELETLRAKVAEFDHIINWHTTCASCARILDSAYAETVRAEKAEERRDQLAGTLGEVLRHFVHKGHPGEPCLGVGWVSVRTVDRWRGILNPPAGRNVRS